MMGKCDGSGMQQGGMMNQHGGMMMNGNMQHDKGMMMQHLDNIKACVNKAQTMQELNACNMQMRKGGPMMPQQQMQKGNMPMNNQMQNNNMPMNGQMMQNGNMPMNSDDGK